MGIQKPKTNRACQKSFVIVLIFEHPKNYKGINSIFDVLRCGKIQGLFDLDDVEIQIEKIGTCFDRLFCRYPKMKTNLITLFAETSEKAKPYEEKIQSFLNKENLEYTLNRFKPLS